MENSMSPVWLFFASLTVVGSVAYNVGMKLGSPGTNPFGFVFVMTSVILVLLGIACLTAKFGFKVDVAQGMNFHAFKFAALCGCAAAMIDIGYILALRYGSMISIQVFWTVGGMVALAVFAALFLKETMPLTKILGIAFGVISVFLITKAP
jgi:drug/metabolite transporter (DMT)-like permease